MRLLILTNLYPPHFLGGYELLCRDVSERLAALGHTVQVLTSDHGGAAPAGPLPVERSLELTRPIGADPRTSLVRRMSVTKHNGRVAAEAIDSFRPDAVFAWNQNRISLGPLYAAQAKGVPVVLTLNDEHMRQFAPASADSPKRALKRGIERWVDPRLTFTGLDLRHATCISHALAARLAGHGFPADQLRVIHQGVPLDLFSPLPKRREANPRPVLLYAGQLHEDKGVCHAIEAVAWLAKCEEIVSLEVVGSGAESDLEFLKTRAQQLGVSDLVHFHGRVPRADMPAIYRSADALIFPSVWEEPFGLTHLEAMGCGVPVISTPVGGCAEFLLHEENALVVQPGSGIEIAAATRRLLGDATLRQHLVQGGLETVESNLNLSRYVSRLEGLLEEAVQAGPIAEQAVA
jgi:glycogen synthase